MLQDNHCTIYPENTDDTAMPHRSGVSVAAELGGRMLVRYLRAADVAVRTSGSPMLPGVSDKVWTTPTPYGPTEVISALSLPFPLLPRPYAIFLKVAKIPVIQGPRRIAGGTGIEYILPLGYPQQALAYPWEQEVK